MKAYYRLIVLLLTVAAVLGATACGNPASGDRTSATTEDASGGTPAGTSVPAETLSPEDAALADRAAAILWETYTLPDRRCFEVNVSHHVSSDKADVEFRLYIGGYRTWESYSVYFAEDGSVAHVFDAHAGVYSRFLEAATPARIAAAEASLEEQVKTYDAHSPFYLSVDDEGCLCLTCEVIVDKAFGDHEHKFFVARICSAE